ncbi:hypothetical protein [Actinorugispora endophytica]|uniref:Uncharacterized protein n=1 Tax=Actinorugispora endophytica TaxID=1605990 RepID=A0A4R6V8R5_9ACTN|nr:hypothetical protein [Actinorugispora endophytica]TDQ55566.1 hypothetical protein EV190_101898 [Actinorugispora endophytica]
MFAAVCVGVSATGHTLLSGHEVPLGGTLVGYVGMLAAAWGFAGRERGGGAIAGWMLWGQLALHLVFSTAQSCAAPLPDGPAHPDHSGASGIDTAATADSSVGMLAAHIAAALICALWLRGGEDAAFTLARGLRTLLSGVLRLLGPLPAAPCPPPDRPRSWAEPRHGTGVVLRHVVVRRGPPRSSDS